MVHRGFSRLISVRSTYTMKEWKEVKAINEYDDQLFTILE
jgi:hypothetical protein